MKALVYSIRSYQTKDIYIGSTTQSLSSRMCNHRWDYTRWIIGKKKYISSFEILKYEDNYIELLEEVEVQSKQELHKLEGEYQRKMDCVNKKIEGQTKQEYYQTNKETLIKQQLKYRDENKEKVKEQQKKYRDENKEKIKKYRDENKDKLNEYLKKYQQINREVINEKQRTKIICECGLILNKNHKIRHLKSKKHIDFLNA